MMEEAGLNSVNSRDYAAEPRGNLDGIYYNAGNQNIGIGSSTDTEGMVPPIGNIPAHLFLANRAPPVYTEHENRNSNATGPGSEAPPSYESIFNNSNNNIQ